MIKLSFPTIKLGKYIKEVKCKVKNTDLKQDDLIVYGVTNTEGITVTNNKASDDLSNYIVLNENQFAYNPYRVNVGSIGLSTTGTFGVVSPAYVVFEATEEISSEFLLYYLKSDLGINLIKWYGDRGGVRSALRFADLKEIDFPDIDFEKQLSILGNMKEIDSKLSELNENLSLENISSLRQAILQQAVEGKLCEQDPTDEPASVLLEKIKAEKEKLLKSPKDKEYFKQEFSAVVIIENRIHIRAELICDFITKGTTPKGDELLTSGAIPFLKVYNIVNNKINFSYRPQYVSNEIHNTFLARSKVYPNDVITNIVGPPLGKVAIIPDDYGEWNINQAIAIFRGLSNVLPKYLYLVLLEGTAINKIVTVGTAGQDNISLAQCRDIIIPLPPLAEQQRIVKKVDKLMALCDELEQEVTSAKKYASQLMEAVLQEAFSNKTIETKDNVIVFAPQPQQVNTHKPILAAAARGKMSEVTWKRIADEAVKLASEES